MFRLVDTHAHLEEIVDLEAALMRAREAGVVAIIAVGSDLVSNHKVLEMANRYKGFVYPALGLHPGSLGNSRHQEETLRFMESSLGQIVAIGEIGLDYHYREAWRSLEHRQEQRQALAQTLELAKAGDKPALIHSRQAWQDCLEMAQQAQIKKAVFHWYSGPLDVLRKIIEAGYFVSATPAAEYSQAHRLALDQVPLAQLLLETDSPVIYQGQAAEPALVRKTLAAVASLKGLDEDNVAEATTANALGLFGIGV